MAPILIDHEESAIHDYIVCQDMDFASLAQEVATLGHLKPGDWVLVPGCGTGALERAMAPMGLHCVGADISQSAIAFCRSEAERQRLPIEYRIGDFARMSFDRLFDAVAIINIDLQEADAHNWLHHSRRLLRPGGSVFKLAIELDDSVARTLHPHEFRAAFDWEARRVEHESKCWPVEEFRLLWQERTAVQSLLDGTQREYRHDGHVDVLPDGATERLMRAVGFGEPQVLRRQKSYVHPITQGVFVYSAAV